TYSPTSTERSTEMTSSLPPSTSALKYSTDWTTLFYTKTSTSDTNCMCYCPTSSKNTSDIQQKLDNIKKDLTLNKKVLNSYSRRLISADDQRTFSKAAGFVAVCVLCTVVGLIIACDITNVVKDTKKVYTVKHK
ncbi:hypothetical protein FSP39_020130, partial [Pinctada imbricata]